MASRHSGQRRRCGDYHRHAREDRFPQICSPRDSAGGARMRPWGALIGATLQMLEEHSRIEIENPVDRALREGSSFRLPRPTLLVSRDGTERVTDITAAPIRDPSGQVLGAVAASVTSRSSGGPNGRSASRSTCSTWPCPGARPRRPDRDSLEHERRAVLRLDQGGSPRQGLPRAAQDEISQSARRIQRELLRTGQWLGELTHTRRDGTPLVVASHWVVQRDEADGRWWRSSRSTRTSPTSAGHQNT